MLQLDLTDNLARFPIAYGYQPVKGWGVKHYETGLAASLQRTKQNALGEGPWDGIDKLYADAFEILSANYALHNGTGTDPADLFFPDEEPHLWTAWISARCPTGISADQADSLFGIYRALRTPNFNGAGVQIDSLGAPIGGGDPRDYYFFKPNPANCAVDQLLRWGQRLPSIVNFPAWVDWRDYNDELIPWDDAKYTPRSLSLTGTSGGSLTPGNTYYIRISAMKGADESSASQKTIEITASDITLAGGQTAFQVNWLIRGDELTPPAPPGDITSYRVYVGTVPGVWLGYFTVSTPTLRTLLITTTSGTTAGSPLEVCTTGLLRDIKRFECGLFLVPPYSLATALDRICQISCADWQWSGLGTGTYQNDMVRFLSPASRTPVFTLDETQVAPGTFKTWAVDRRQRYNQIVGTFRDRDDDFLNVGPPVVLDRGQMQLDDKQVKTFTIDFGTCYRSQVQRGVSFWARTLCDLDTMASLNGSPKTYFLLPADVVNVTNDTPGWTDQQFVVAKKSETIETAIGDALTMQIYSPDAYSDTDHSPLPSPLRTPRFDPLSAPPVATDLVLTADDVLITGIIGDFNFGTYPAKQIARIFIKGPADAEPSDSTYREPWPPVDPGDSLAGHFEIKAVIPGKYWVKVVTESALGASAPSGHPVATIDLRPAAPTDLAAVVDSSLNWHFRMTGNPRTAEIPASYIFRVRRFSDGVLMRDLPAQQNSPTSFAVLWPDIFGGGHADNNNLFPGTAGSADDRVTVARSVQEITDSGTAVDFVMDQDITADDFSLNNRVDLIPSALSPWDVFDGSGANYSAFLAVIGGGSAKRRLTVNERDPIDGPVEMGTADVLLPMKLRIAFVGSQVRFYVDWVNSASKPFAVGTRTLMFPLKLRGNLSAGNYLKLGRVSGLSDPQTIYSTAQQIQDNEANGGSGALNDITVEGWQVSPLTPPDFKGISTAVTRFTY